MGLGSTAKKLQRVADTAEKLYSRINDLRDQMVEMQKTVTETKDRLDVLETESAEQRALLEALAEREGIDVDSVTADAHIREAETEASDDSADGAASVDADDATPESEAAAESEAAVDSTDSTAT